MKRLGTILFLLLPLLTWANEEQLDNLHCGDVVIITATPDSGYRFVMWSDENTDSIRQITVSQADTLTAIFEPLCVSDEVPVVFLYNQLAMVHVDSLQRMGYVFSGKNVEWYLNEEQQPRGTGYYYSVQPNDKGYLYAAVDVSQTPASSKKLCTDVIYSRAISVGATGLTNVNDNDNRHSRKVIIDNQLYIIVGGHTYRADGSRLK